MIFSLEQLFSNDQAITATANSTNVIDLGTPGTPYRAAARLHRDTGKGNPVPIRIQVTEDFATLTSLTIALVASDNSNLSSGVTLDSQTILVADLVEGATTFMQLLPNGVDKRYLGLVYTVTGSNASAGKITAGITAGNQTNVTGA